MAMSMIGSKIAGTKPTTERQLTGLPGRRGIAAGMCFEGVRSAGIRERFGRQRACGSETAIA
jgi:hypothetical protein